MTCKECGQVVKLTRTMNKCHSNTELSSHEETRCQFNGGRCAIKLGIDVHQDFYLVVEQVGASGSRSVWPYLIPCYRRQHSARYRLPGFLSGSAQTARSTRRHRE